MKKAQAEHLRSLAVVEIEAWHNLVAVLKTSGAVTQADCEAPASAKPTTVGTHIFAAIRAWGDRSAELAVASAAFTGAKEAK